MWLAIAGYQFLALGVLLSVGLLIVFRLSGSLSIVGYRHLGWRSWAAAGVAVIPIYAGVAILYALFNAFLPGYHVRGNAQELLQGASPHVGLVQGLGIALFAAIEAPLTEETLFRGFLFQGLRGYFARYLPYQGAVLAGAIVSGLTFGLLHFEVHTLPILVFLGIALAYIFQVTDSLFASVLTHGIINLVAVVGTFHISP